MLYINCTSSPKSGGVYLNASERIICDTLHLDTTILIEIRRFNSKPIEPFHYSLGRMIKDGKEYEVDPVRLQGILLEEENSKSYRLIYDLKNTLKSKGYTIFMLEKNFNIDRKADVIGVLKTLDKYSIIKQIGTDGINYDITNDSLLTVIKQFDKKYSIDLIGASGDYCEFDIQNSPTDWKVFADEVYKVCPDVVDQGTGTIEALAEEMKRTKRLYFWWD